MWNVAQENRKHRPELQSHTANWRRPTRSGVRLYRWSHRNSPRAHTEPNTWGDAPSQKRNAHQWRKPSAKTVQEGRQCDGTDQRDRRKETAEGTLRTKPESVSKAHRRSGQGHHQEGARDGTSERLRQGLQLRNKREKGDKPQKGKDQAEREEPTPTCSRREDHSKRSGSHRAPRESSGRGRSLTRRRRLQAQKPTCRQEAEQSRWTWKRTYGQGSTMERTKISHDPQLQWGPPGKRAPAAAGSKSSHRPRYKTPASRSRAGHPRQPQTLSKGCGGNPELQHIKHITNVIK